jgi:pyruvate kinase
VRSLKLSDGQRPCILTDLAGPKIRITDVLPNFKLKVGQSINITNENDADENHIRVTSGIGFADVFEGAKILINDGRIKLQVNDIISTHTLKCETIIGGEIEPNKGVNFPGITLDTPALTDQDKIDLRVALEMGADWIALSFVRSAKDMDNVLAIMDEAGVRRPIMAKIEKWEALKNIKDITTSFDAVMVARGDLGVEIPAEKVPLAQKQVIEVAATLGKPVVIATQMLESMVNSQTPTRAEVSDIANSIFDSVDAILLTGETAIGQYPVEVISTLNRVIQQTEKANDIQRTTLRAEVSKTADAISRAVCEITHDLDINVVMTMTHSGSTARMIARYRPLSKVYALTPFDHIMRQLQLVWGVTPMQVETYKNMETVPDICKKVIEKFKLISKGNKFVITGGVPMGVPGTTNYVSVQTF